MNKRFTRNTALLILASLMSVNISFAKSNYSYTPGAGQSQYQGNYYPAGNSYGNGQQTLKGRVVTVPPGIGFSAVVSAPLSSEYLTMGQPVSVTTGSDFYYNNCLIAPAGSTVTGVVTQVTKAKHGTINGALRLRFTEITTPYGTRIPISATIRTDDGTGILRAGTKMDTAKEYGKDLVVGSALGALAGTIMGPLSGGAVGRGAALGTAVGAVGGLGKSIYDKGTDVVIPSGANIDLMIDQPITVNPSATNYDY